MLDYPTAESATVDPGVGFRKDQNFTISPGDRMKLKKGIETIEVERCAQVGLFRPE